MPSGVTASAVNGTSTFTMDNTGITLTGGGTLVINSAGIALDGKLFAPHTHTGVQSGTSVTGPVA
jgi:hypothetical protein